MWQAVGMQPFSTREIPHKLKEHKHLRSAQAGVYAVDHRLWITRAVMPALPVESSTEGERARTGTRLDAAIYFPVPCSSSAFRA